MELSAEQTAAQLRCPHDEAGTAFGQAMNLRNLTQIVSAFAAARLQNGDNILETGCGNGGLWATSCRRRTACTTPAWKFRR